jgi:hypothetical protein
LGKCGRGRAWKCGAARDRGHSGQDLPACHRVERRIVYHGDLLSARIV